MSFKRGSKPPARPPPPRGGLSLGGMSFKKLEQEEEEEEEDLTISDKYTSLLQHARTNSSLSNLPSSGKGGAPPVISSISVSTAAKTDPLTSEAEEGDKVSPQKWSSKSVFEYKEILSGLKGKIQEKITKTIEDISGDSSASASPDKEHPTQGPLNDGFDTPAVVTTQNSEEAIPKTAAVKLRASGPEALARPSSVPQLVRAGSEERASQGSSERSSTPQPAQLSAVVADDGTGEENIMVFEEHFKEEPYEDFTGGLTLTTSTTVRSRSKLTPLKKKAPKTLATVSMSGLMKTPDTEKNSCGVGSDSNKSEVSKTGSDGSTPLRSVSIMRLVSQDGQTIQWPKLVALSACLFAYFILPMPSYLSGLITGCVLASLFWSVYNWLMQPPRVREMPVLTPIADLPPMEIPEMKEPTLEDGTYKVRGFVFVVVCMCAWVYACMCVCVHACVCMCVHVCVCVCLSACVCVCVREREKKKNSVGCCFIPLRQHVSEWLIVHCGKEKKWEGVGTYFYFRVKRK